jgi:hypothetical protein
MVAPEVTRQCLTGLSVNVKGELLRSPAFDPSFAVDNAAAWGNTRFCWLVASPDGSRTKLLARPDSCNSCSKATRCLEHVLLSRERETTKSYLIMVSSGMSGSLATSNFGLTAGCLVPPHMPRHFSSSGVVILAMTPQE